MFCSKCGSENGSDSRFCNKCGSELNSNEGIHTQTQQPPKESEHPTPVGLIATSWIVFALSLFNNFLGFGLAIIVGFGVLLCSILLLVNASKTAKTNGIIILIIWIVTFLIGLMNS